MEVLVGMLLGWAIVASLVAATRLFAPRPAISREGRARQSALHATVEMLPGLRRGLSPESAHAAAGPLRELTQADALALCEGDRVLAFNGAGADHHTPGDDAPVARRDAGVRAEPDFRCAREDCPLHAAVVAPLVVRGERVGSLITLHREAAAIVPEALRVAGEAAALASAGLELSALEAQGERLAHAELRALRAQISPHFIYNALAAVASYIHSRPDEARELLSEFAEFTRYAFRRERPFVTLADELQYVEKYLRLEQARFGERLAVRIEVDPAVLAAAVPVLSLQPLVENAVRHGVERRGSGHVEIVARDRDTHVELRVIDDGVGMDADSARVALAGGGRGIGLSNVQARLQASLGPEYGLALQSRPGRGTTVTMTLPKLPGVRAA